MDYLRQVGGSKEAAKELKLFNLSDYLTNRFSALSQQIYEENVALNRRRLIWGGLLAVIGQLGYYAAYVLSIYRTIKGDYTIGDLTLITTAIMQAMGNIQQAFSTASGVADQALFLTDLLAFFEMKPRVEIQAGRHARAAPHRARFRVPQRFVCLSGHHAARSRATSISPFAPGERVALIGENGQGKTTVVKLITRLYDPTEGQILLDGIDLREYDLDDLHSEIGVIFQDFMRYEMTARENIAVGPHRSEHAPEEIEYAAEKSLASGVVAKAAAAATTRCWAGASKAAWTFPAANGRSWLWRAPICATRNCSSSTSPPHRSTRAASSRSSSASPSSPTAKWRC